MEKLSILFLFLFQKGFMASCAVLVICLIRLCLKRAPRVFSYLLWMVVWFRLLCPVTLESNFGLITFSFGGIFQEEQDKEGTEQILTTEGNYEVSQWLNQTSGNQELAQYPNQQKKSKPLEVCLSIAAVIWLTGVVFLLSWQIVSGIRLKRKLKRKREAAGKKDTLVFVLEGLETAFVWGLRKPRIYLPAGLEEEERKYILRHEEVHIRRKDYLVRAIAGLAVCLYWFHPLIWLAFRLMNEDMETSCDEAVLRELGSGIKKDYAVSLLAMATERSKKQVPLESPHFVEREIKERVRHVLEYKKAAKWSIAAACLVVLLAGAGLAFNQTHTAKETTIVFPAYQGGKNEYNQSIYETEPFSLQMTLPKGWYISNPPEEEQEASSPWTPVLLFDEEDRQVGFAGFGRFENEEGVPQEDYYKVAFAEIRLGSVISWCNDYTPVLTEENRESAVCQIYRSEDGVTEEAPAIVAYDRQLGIYVAVSLETDSVTEEKLKEIAESITIEPVTEP